MFHFEPTIETNIFEPIPPNLREILKAFKTIKFRDMEVLQGFGNQRNKDKNCFIRCLRFISLIYDGVELENFSKFTNTKILFDQKQK